MMVNGCRGVLVLCVIILALTWAGPGAAQQELPDEFGLGYNLLSVSAEEFRPMVPSSSWTWQSNGIGFWLHNSLNTEQLIAPLRLPAGAVITDMTVIYFDTEAAKDLAVEIDRMWVDTGGSSGAPAIAPAFQSSGAPGMVFVFVDVLPHHTVQYVIGSGAQSYSVKVSMPGSNFLRLRGVFVGWNRQVSPAPVTATFSDVPVGAFAFQHIEALAASGITSGCGGGNFCPDAPLTRAQMAVFLAKALGLHWAY